MIIFDDNAIDSQLLDVDRLFGVIERGPTLKSI